MILTRDGLAVAGPKSSFSRINQPRPFEPVGKSSRDSLTKEKRGCIATSSCMPARPSSIPLTTVSEGDGLFPGFSQKAGKQMRLTQVS
jgi:hypothetical protein